MELTSHMLHSFYRKHSLNMMWFYSVIFMLLLKDSYQEDIDGRQMLEHLTILMEARFSVLDIRLNDIASKLRDVKPQQDPALSEEPVLSVESRLYNVEGNLGDIKANQEQNNIDIMQKLNEIEQRLADNTCSDIQQRLDQIEVSLGGVDVKVSSLMTMAQNIGQEAEELGNKYDENQVIKEETLKELENMTMKLTSFEHHVIGRLNETSALLPSESKITSVDKIMAAITDMTTLATSTCPEVTITPCAVDTCTPCPTNDLTTEGPTVSPNLPWHTVGRDRFVKPDQEMNWINSRALCQSYSLDLYRPYNITAVAEYLEETFSYNTWIGSRGNGIHQRWLSGEVLTSAEPWYGEHYTEVGTDKCLEIIGHSGWYAKGQI
ncbi:unnamed protein product, partial [Meganyctiphanes norvegica]